MVEDEDAVKRLQSNVEFLQAAERVAGYRLPEELESPLRKAHLRAWLSWKNDTITPSARDREWHLRVSRHLEESRQTTCAALYHTDRVSQIEAELDAVIAQFRDATAAQDGGGHFYAGV